MGAGKENAFDESKTCNDACVHRKDHDGKHDVGILYYYIQIYIYIYIYIYLSYIYNKSCPIHANCSTLGLAGRQLNAMPVPQFL